MDAGELVRLSRRERELYGALLGIYRGLAAVLRDEAVPVDPARLAAAEARVEETTAVLRGLAGTLGGCRLSGEAVPPVAEALWRDSARLAADALRAGAEVTALARARQARLAARLTSLAAGRRGLAGYRSAPAVAAGVHV